MVLLAAAGWGSDWNPKLAAEYLDGRQKEWLAWPTANASGTACFSCHTGAPYLFARPALRKALGEAEPTSFETALRDALKARLVKKTTKEWNPNGKEPGVSQGLGVESVWAAMFLGSEEAFERMWSLQIREGKRKGSWAWFSLNDDPWEMPDSVYYGASMAALATSMAPKEYRGGRRSGNGPRPCRVFADELPSQSLHNRLAALLASAKSNDFLPDAARKAIVEEAWKKQSADGGWPLESLGPWTPHAVRRRRGEQQLCDGGRGAGIAAGGGEEVGRAAGEGAGVAEGPAESGDGRVAGGFDEQEVQAGFDDGAVHAGRGDGVRVAGAARDAMSPAAWNPLSILRFEEERTRPCRDLAARVW